ncbi:MAG: methylmalonyl Co-A mutase-associated GTPase MeaB, partial [Hymenobacteraceae bacterium]|nr:methylmalonyl Co-A mutase-associated GTPase MeaB [Hymenobacteraceae bacterium]MDX5395112.1 methylmalonyl Co-A mutase-associated GTPase MeaB [Hymenobacteraceae bacterium]MDX5443003.1 methylmalonyl Co-A mutase-associated GTPase MeaB [Hymenobacteraceae bacterium]MDX5511150.1 methylmalonyl Co-A mutase-associated GTPase MeaB [Hymenobacteraceae bacterium]
VDFFLLLMLAGAGDELQGIKKGIMEMADAIAITKADGNNLTKAKAARAEYQSALHLFPLSTSGWSPKVTVCSAVEKTGISDIWQTMEEYLQLTKQNGYFLNNRREQNLHWLYEAVRQSLEERFYAHPEVKAKLAEVKEQVMHEQLSAFSAANELLKLA